MQLSDEQLYELYDEDPEAIVLMQEHRGTYIPMEVGLAMALRHLATVEGQEEIRKEIDLQILRELLEHHDVEHSLEE